MEEVGKESLRIPTFPHVSLRKQGGSALPPGVRSFGLGAGRLLCKRLPGVGLA